MTNPVAAVPAIVPVVWTWPGWAAAWLAVCACLLGAIANKEPSLPKTLQQTLQVIGVPVFEPVPLVELFDAPTANNTPANELLLVPQLDSGGG